MRNNGKIDETNLAKMSYSCAGCVVPWRARLAFSENSMISVVFSLTYCQMWGVLGDYAPSTISLVKIPHCTAVFLSFLWQFHLKTNMYINIFSLKSTHTISKTSQLHPKLCAEKEYGYLLALVLGQKPGTRRKPGENAQNILCVNCRHYGGRSSGLVSYGPHASAGAPRYTQPVSRHVSASVCVMQPHT